MPAANAAAKSKTTFTTPSDLEVVATRTFDAPRRLLWQAHTDPKHVPKWMTGPAGWTMPVCEIDLRVGGEWHFVWQKTKGEQMEMRGIYREVTPIERLVNTERWGPEWPETINTTSFAEKGGRTTLTSSVRYPNKEARDAAMKTGMADGWSTSYDRLDEHLREMA